MNRLMSKDLPKFPPYTDIIKELEHENEELRNALNYYAKLDDKIHQSVLGKDAGNDVSSIARMALYYCSKDTYTVSTETYKNEWPIPPGTKLGKRPSQNPVCRKCNGEGFIQGMMSGDWIKCDHQTKTPGEK